MYPVDDPQALRNPRPDFTGYPQSRGQIVEPLALTVTTFVGSVTVQTT